MKLIITINRSRYCLIIISIKLPSKEKAVLRYGFLPSELRSTAQPLHTIIAAIRFPIIMVVRTPLHGMAESLQGDVVQITLNPIRYRGYVYDFETGFYYLQSRYYDPQVRRFISADDLGMLGISGTFLSYNSYSYCENDPVNYSDITGFSISAVGFGIQIELNIGAWTMGVELIWYYGELHGARNKFMPYVYIWWSGMGFGFEQYYYKINEESDSFIRTF